MTKSNQSAPVPVHGRGDTAADPSHTIDLALSLRAMRGDLKATRLLRQSAPSNPARAIDLGALETSADLAEAQGRILRAAALGQISAREATQLGEQIELLGRALERDKLAKAIGKLREKVSTTKRAKVEASIHAEVETVSACVDEYVSRVDEDWDTFLERHGDDATEIMIAENIIAYLHLLAGMNYGDFFTRGRDGHLPRAMQDIFDCHNDERQLRQQKLNSKSYRNVLFMRRPDRWTPSGWACVCNCQSTLWVESDLRVPDRIQIYCEACRKLSGWGTAEEFDRAHEDGHASWLERIDTQFIQTLDPPPVAGVKAFLKSRRIGVGHRDDDT